MEILKKIVTFRSFALRIGLHRYRKRHPLIHHQIHYSILLCSAFTLFINLFQCTWLRNGKNEKNIEKIIAFSQLWTLNDLFPQTPSPLSKIFQILLTYPCFWYQLMNLYYFCRSFHSGFRMICCLNYLIISSNLVSWIRNIRLMEP